MPNDDGLCTDVVDNVLSLAQDQSIEISHHETVLVYVYGFNS